MGTRHVISIKMDGEVRVAQYGQHDGYPRHHGVKILKFLKENDLNLFKEKLKRCRLLNENDDEDMNFMTNFDVTPVHKRTPEQTHWFKHFISRDVSSDIFQNILQSNLSDIPLINDSDFLNDASCEFSYLIDFDRGIFQTISYHNIVIEYDLNNLPGDDQYLEAFNKREKEI